MSDFSDVAQNWFHRNIIKIQMTKSCSMKEVLRKHNHLAICEVGKAGCLAMTVSQLVDAANGKAFSDLSCIPRFNYMYLSNTPNVRS